MSINKNKSSQKGNIFAVLFGAVALTGVLAAVSMQTVTGPVRTVTKVTQKNMVDNDLMTANKIIVATAAAQTDDGDCDADGFVEPAPWRDAGSTPAPTGGGLLPNTIGANTIDPWGSEYGYCVWDHRTVDAAGCGGASQLRLQGPTAILSNQLVLAVVSAGPDKTFQTTCRDWLDANTDNEPDNPLIEKTAGSDDYIIKQTYIEAANTGGGQGLWNIKDADANVAEIGKDLEIKDSGGDVNVSISSSTGVGDFLGITTDVITPRNTSTNRIDLDGFLDFSRANVPTGQGYITIDQVGQYSEEIGLLMRLDGDSKTSGGTDMFMQLQSDDGGNSDDATDKFIIYGDGLTEIYGKTSDGNEILYIKKTSDTGGHNALHLDTATDRNIGIRFSNQGARKWDIYNDGALGSNNNRFTIAGDNGYDSDPKLTILQGGNVGIGNNLPLATLHVTSSGPFWGNRTMLLQSPDDSDSGWQFQPGNHADTPSILRIGYRTDNNDPTVMPLALTEDGKVGINTTSPGEALHVNGDIIAQGNTIYFNHDGATDSNNDYIQYNDTNGEIQSGSKGTLILYGENARGVTDFTAPSVGISAHTGYIRTRLGINVTAPEQALDIDGSIKLTGNIFFEDGSSILSDTTDKAVSVYSGTNNSTGAGIQLMGSTKSSNAGRMFLNSVVSSSAAFTMRNYNGTGWDTLVNVAFDGDTTIFGSGTTCTIGDGVGATSCTSDRRLKKNIRDFENASDILSQSRGVRYNWNETAGKDTNIEMIGVIAQEVQEVLPELVKEDEETGYLRVSMEGYIPVLIEAFKELKTENDNLKSSLHDLKTQNEKLENRLIEIEKFIKKSQE